MTVAVKSRAYISPGGFQMPRGRAALIDPGKIFSLIMTSTYILSANNLHASRWCAMGIYGIPLEVVL